MRGDDKARYMCGLKTVDDKLYLSISWIGFIAIIIAFTIVNVYVCMIGFILFSLMSVYPQLCRIIVTWS